MRPERQRRNLELPLTAGIDRVRIEDRRAVLDDDRPGRRPRAGTDRADRDREGDVLANIRWAGIADHADGRVGLDDVLDEVLRGAHAVEMVVAAVGGAERIIAHDQGRGHGDLGDILRAVEKDGERALADAVAHERHRAGQYAGGVLDAARRHDVVLGDDSDVVFAEDGRNAGRRRHQVDRAVGLVHRLGEERFRHYREVVEILGRVVEFDPQRVYADFEVDAEQRQRVERKLGVGQRLRDADVFVG